MVSHAHLILNYSTGVISASCFISLSVFVLYKCNRTFTDFTAHWLDQLVSFPDQFSQKLGRIELLKLWILGRCGGVLCTVAEKHTILYLGRVRAGVSGHAANYYLRATVRRSLWGVRTPTPALTLYSISY